MEPGARFELPSTAVGTLRSLYLHRGSGARVLGREIPADHRVEIEGHAPVDIVAGAEPTEFLLLQGKPIGEPVAKRGPFVMNTQQEIRQAYADFQRTQFGGWPWNANDPVHVRTKGRFAKKIDGTFEEPT
jgi:redox-sensitive bicupin YhaK (pirin superfamily)